VIIINETYGQLVVEEVIEFVGCGLWQMKNEYGNKHV